MPSETDRSPHQHRIDAIHALRTRAARLMARGTDRAVREEALVAWRELNDALAWLARHEAEPGNPFLHVIDLELQVAATRLGAAQHLLDDGSPVV